MKHKKRQLAAIMFTDMVGYTALMQKDEKLAKLKRDRHRQVIQETTAEHEGKILQYYGDGTLSIFSSAIEAVHCAIEMQDQFREEPQIPLRIGIHSGDIVYDEEGAYGDAVNVASRIEGLAGSGSVMVSDKLYDDIKNHTDISTKPMGLFKLKNVKREVGVFAISNKGLKIPDISAGKKEDKRVKSIAVLPFVNMSANPENEYFSDGISEELLNTLTRLDGLQVTARTSSFAFKGKNEDVRSIGEQLGVQTILEGSVRTAGNKVRITAQLVNTKDGYHLWSETFDRDLEDIFAVQDEISEKIANKLRADFSETKPEKAEEKKPTHNIDAYNDYLKGLFQWNKWTPESCFEAIQHFENAIKKAADFTLAYAQLAMCYSIAGSKGQLKGAEAFPKAKEAAQKALELDPESAEAHMSLGIIKMAHDWDWEGAESEFKKTLELNPNLDMGKLIYGMFLVAMKRPDEGITFIDKALQNNPLALNNLKAMGDAHMFSKKYEKAIEYYDRALSIDPNFRAVVESKGFSLFELGKPEEGLEMVKAYQAMIGDPLKGQGTLGVAYAKAGKTEEALVCLEKLKEREIRDPHASMTMDFAILYAALKDYDKAFEYLEKAFEQRFMLVFMRTHPVWDSLREDPRFIKLMKRIDG